MKYRPYPKYKPSGIEWFGDIPDHWGVVGLKWISYRYAGGTPDRSNDAFWDEGTIPWINSGAVNQGLITEPSAHITLQAYQNSSAKWVSRGALVMALAGQGKTKGMVAQTSIETTCNQSMAAICPKDGMHSRYLYWLLVSQYQEIRGMAGTEQRDGLNLEIIGAIPCLQIPEEEQSAIARFLDKEATKVTVLAAKKLELIEKLKERRTALISQTVTHGLPPEAARAAGLDPHPKFKASDVEWLGDIPEVWKAKSLKRTAREGRKTFTDGDWIEAPFVADEGMRLIQTGNVGIGVFREQGFRYISPESFLSLRCTEVMPNDVLICRLDGPVGRACAAPDLGIQMITSVDNAILKTAETVDPRYVVYLMSSSNWLEWFQTISRAGGGFRFRVSRSALGETRIPIPPTHEQCAIADYLDRETVRIDRMIEKVEAAIERLQEYRTALITAAVTGKIDVREAAASL